jgi:hypothetical protein
VNRTPSRFLFGGKQTRNLSLKPAQPSLKL